MLSGGTDGPTGRSIGEKTDVSGRYKCILNVSITGGSECINIPLAFCKSMPISRGFRPSSLQIGSVSRWSSMISQAGSYVRGWTMPRLLSDARKREMASSLRRGLSSVYTHLVLAPLPSHPFTFRGNTSSSLPNPRLRAAEEDTRCSEFGCFTA